MFDTFLGGSLTYDTGQHDVVIIRDLALELGKSHSALHSHCRLRGYPFSRVRAPGSRGSLAVAISDAHAQAVRARYSPVGRHTVHGQSLVAIRQLAEEFEMTPAGIRYHCRLRGYEFVPVVTPASRKRQTFAVRAADAERIRAYYWYHRHRFRPPGWTLPEVKP